MKINFINIISLHFYLILFLICFPIFEVNLKHVSSFNWLRLFFTGHKYISWIVSGSFRFDTKKKKSNNRYFQWRFLNTIFPRISKKASLMLFSKSFSCWEDAGIWRFLIWSSSWAHNGTMVSSNSFWEISSGDEPDEEAFKTSNPSTIDWSNASVFLLNSSKTWSIRSRVSHKLI